MRKRTIWLMYVDTLAYLDTHYVNRAYADKEAGLCAIREFIEGNHGVIIRETFEGATGDVTFIYKNKDETRNMFLRHMVLVENGEWL